MYICICMAVSDSVVRTAIESGATTVGAVTKACAAGGDCGACHDMIESMIEDHLDASDYSAPPAQESTERLLPPATLKGPRAA
jgi:bacterioferritin-associated ferredoxin